MEFGSNHVYVEKEGEEEEEEIFDSSDFSKAVPTPSSRVTAGGGESCLLDIFHYY